jgi:succinate-semialdehyde dehydrogenase/glutarate-semialdehyde dehydrogenase
MARLLINGEFRNSSSGEISWIRNPANTDEKVDSVPVATVDDAKEAIESAKEGFEKWAKISPPKKGAILLKIAEVLRNNCEELSILLTKEHGKTLSESRKEIKKAANRLTFYAGLAPQISGRVSLLEGLKKYFTVIKEPYGVTAGILPWNVPVTKFVAYIAPALAAGNSVIVKPASTAPLTLLKIGEVLTHLNLLPKGVLNIVVGPGNTVGEELVRNSEVSKIVFTGSTESGMKVSSLAGRHFKHVSLELGGSDPMIVCEDADIDKAVKAAVISRFRMAGQVCMAVKRIFLHESVYESFREKLVKEVSKITVGNGLDPRVSMGPLHNREQLEEIEGQVEDALNKGGTVLTGGMKPKGKEFQKGYFYLPTVIEQPSLNSRVMMEETFGPVLPLNPFSTIEEAIELANSSVFGLTGSVWTRDLKKAHMIMEELQVGTVWVNNRHESITEAPFGGVKKSGIGREFGKEGLEEFLKTKTIVINNE